MRSWQPEEDRVIIELMASIGPRWKQITQVIPFRSVASVRNRWLRIAKGNSGASQAGSGVKHCKLCGLPRRGHVCFERIRQNVKKD